MITGILIFLVGTFMLHIPASASNLAISLQLGSQGDEVKQLQQLLLTTGHYSKDINGQFNAHTIEAVVKFQMENNLTVDGIVGNQTWDTLLSVQAGTFNNGENNTISQQPISYTIKTGDTLFDLANHFRCSVKEITLLNPELDPYNLQIGQILIMPIKTSTSRGGNGQVPDLRLNSAALENSVVELIHWNEVNSIYTSKATVIDVLTGLTFNVQRRGGRNHADSEPLTAQDTDILKKIYGGKWSWDRRAIIVEVNGKKIAASMNGMPHGGWEIKNNNFNGHFCIHFLGSSLHTNNRVDPLHQKQVYLAAGE